MGLESFSQDTPAENWELLRTCFDRLHTIRVDLDMLGLDLFYLGTL